MFFFFTCGKPQHDTVQGLQKIANHTSCYNIIGSAKHAWFVSSVPDGQSKERTSGHLHILRKLNYKRSHIHKLIMTLASKQILEAYKNVIFLIKHFD